MPAEKVAVLLILIKYSLNPCSQVWADCDTFSFIFEARVSDLKLRHDFCCFILNIASQISTSSKVQGREIEGGSSLVFLSLKPFWCPLDSDLMDWCSSLDALPGPKSNKSYILRLGLHPLPRPKPIFKDLSRLECC